MAKRTFLTSLLPIFWALVLSPSFWCFWPFFFNTAKVRNETNHTSRLLLYPHHWNVWTWWVDINTLKFSDDWHAFGSTRSLTLRRSETGILNILSDFSAFCRFHRFTWPSGALLTRSEHRTGLQLVVLKFSVCVCESQWDRRGQKTARNNSWCSALQGASQDDLLSVLQRRLF